MLTFRFLGPPLLYWKHVIQLSHSFPDDTERYLLKEITDLQIIYDCIARDELEILLKPKPMHGLRVAKPLEEYYTMTKALNYLKQFILLNRESRRYSISKIIPAIVKVSNNIVTIDTSLEILHNFIRDRCNENNIKFRTIKKLNLNIMI